MKDLNLKPYKPKLLQASNEDDPDRRVQFCEWILNSSQEHSAFRTMIWQQDGAPPHYGQIVRDFLDDTFVEWIGRRGTVE